MTEAMIVIHLRHLLPRILSTLPEDNASSANASLFELAPSGVYPAKLITKFAVRSYRTISPLPRKLGGFLSVALAVGSRPPGVTWHSALWSPDFPRILTINCQYTRLSSRLSGGSLTANEEMARCFYWVVVAYALCVRC